MKASEARELTNKYKDSSEVMEQIHTILHDIQMAAEKGYSIIKIPFMTDKRGNTIYDHLKELGYKIDHYSDQREQTSYTTVSW